MRSTPRRSIIPFEPRSLTPSGLDVRAQRFFLPFPEGEFSYPTFKWLGVITIVSLLWKNWKHELLRCLTLDIHISVKLNHRASCDFNIFLKSHP